MVNISIKFQDSRLSGLYRVALQQSTLLSWFNNETAQSKRQYQGFRHPPTAQHRGQRQSRLILYSVQDSIEIMTHVIHFSGGRGGFSKFGGKSGNKLPSTFLQPVLCCFTETSKNKYIKWVKWLLRCIHEKSHSNIRNICGDITVLIIMVK